MADSVPVEKPKLTRKSRRFDEAIFRAGTGAFGVLLIVIVAAIGVELWRQSQLSIKQFGWQFWLTDTWDPVAVQFGARPYHLGHAVFVGPGAHARRPRSRSASRSTFPSSRPTGSAARWCS